MKAWYFSHNNKRLGFGDNRIIKTGITHKNPIRESSVITEPIVLCGGELHGSIRPIDALAYTQGRYVWRVELGGHMVHYNNKIVATERTYLWGFDATEVMKKFTRLCALDVVHLWDAPEIVVRYLKTGDDSIRDEAWTAADARVTARDDLDVVGTKAEIAADDAAWAAARSSRAAAVYAMWAAARAAEEARAALWVASYKNDAVYDAAKEKQNNRLYRMLMDGRKS